MNLRTGNSWGAVRSPPSIFLMGGWGYQNLGDDVILSGYVDHLQQWVDRPLVLSRDPLATFRSVPPLLRARHIRERYQALGHRNGDVLVACGGGYLNGSWRREPTRKLALAAYAAANGMSVFAHGVEFTKMNRPTQRRLAALALGEGQNTTRDLQSTQALRATGVAASTGLDSIALSRDLILRLPPDERSMSRVILSLHNVPRRPDRAEARFDVETYAACMRDLHARLGRQALILAVDERDARFSRQVLPGAACVVPGSVTEFVGLLKGARGIISTRMHPGLIASIAGVPARVLSYNRKVPATLSQLGMEDAVLCGRRGGSRSSLDSEEALDSLSSLGDRYHQRWEDAASDSQRSLAEGLEGSGFDLR